MHVSNCLGAVKVVANFDTGPSIAPQPVPASIPKNVPREVPEAIPETFPQAVRGQVQIPGATQVGRYCSPRARHRYCSPCHCCHRLSIPAVHGLWHNHDRSCRWDLK